MKRKVYVVLSDNGIGCYSNLAKVIRDTPKITYSPLYRALKETNKVEREGYIIYKTELQ